MYNVLPTFLRNSGTLDVLTSVLAMLIVMQVITPLRSTDIMQEKYSFTRSKQDKLNTPESMSGCTGTRVRQLHHLSF